MSRKLYRMILRRRIVVVFLILLQLALIVFLTVSGKRFSVWIEYTLTLVSIFVAFHVIGENLVGAYKLIWLALILAFPVFGGLLYLVFNYQRSMTHFQKEALRMEKIGRPLFLLADNYYEKACLTAPDYKTQIHYLQEYEGFPVYGRTQVVYLTPGEVKFEYLIKTFEKAERYIFLEYFAIENGMMWSTVLEILKKKARQGVEIRIMYDDIGCFLSLPKDYPQQLARMGIKCKIFNPVQPSLAAKQNNRDHRKIVVVDGKVAITGGINLADEYINAKEKYGHWKDAAVMLEGDAAWSFTLMFLQMWTLCTGADEDFTAYYPIWPEGGIPAGDGLVLPYADSPLDYERVGEYVYVQIINTAKEYIYINTPYLVIDDHLLSSLTLAAKSGVDVRIVTPHKPDKWYVHMTTCSYYRELIRAGVKVYEYSDGFIHSKTFVSDGKVATVGSANLDFRSLYLSFECGVWLYGSQAVQAIHDDFVATLENCHQITEQECKSTRLAHMSQDVLRLLAPLL